MSSFAARRDAVVRALVGENYDAAVVSNPVNVTYLTGFTGEASFLIAAPGRAILVTDGRFTEQVEHECPGLEVQLRPLGKTTTVTLGEALTDLGYRRVAVEALHLTLAAMESIASAAETVWFAPTKGLVEAGRMVKDAGEIAQIRRAIDIAERTFAAFRALLGPDDTELELTDALEANVRRAGGRGTSFPPIVAVGDRSALAHAPPTGRTVASGDWVLVDWGGHNGLYRSDLTRILRPHTPHFRRTPEPAAVAKLEAVYRAVLAAQAAAVAAIAPGVRAADVDAAARAELEKVGLVEAFTHGLGHGIGLQTHEGPNLRPNSEDVLAAGMVVTVEPGVYIPGWGGVRIEDDVLVTPDGRDVMSAVPRDWDSTLL